MRNLDKKELFGQNNFILINKLNYVKLFRVIKSHTFSDL